LQYKPHKPKHTIWEQIIIANYKKKDIFLIEKLAIIGLWGRKRTDLVDLKVEFLKTSYISES
jgi:hypothetical protein